MKGDLVEDMVLYDALIRARENAREKDWPGDVATLQRAIGPVQSGAGLPDALTALRTQLEAAQADKAEACDRAREEEREACAKVADRYATWIAAEYERTGHHPQYGEGNTISHWLSSCAAAIRARSLSSSVKEE